MRDQDDDGRLRSENAVRAEAAYQALMQSTSDGLYVFRGTRCVDCNNKAAEILGWPIDKIKGVPPWSPELSPPTQLDGRDSREKGEEMMARARAGECLVFDWVHTRSDGSPVYVEVGLHSVVKDDESFVVALLRDVSARRSAEEALRVSEQKFASAFHASPDTIVIVSLDDFRLIEVNKSFERSTGVTREEAIGKTAVELGIEDPSQQSRMSPLAEVVRKGGGLRDLPARYTSRTGEEIIVELSAEAVEIAGEPCALIASHDITQRKRAEEELQEKDGLLRQAQKMEAVGQLAGGVAHDFNNLLTSITGYTQLALGNLDVEDSVTRDLHKVLELSRRAADLTRQLLAFSRRQPLAPQILNLNTLVESSAKMFKRLIGENIEVEVELSPDIGNVKADPGQVEQVLMNLAVNARDAMPEGGKLVIETTNTELDDSHCARRPGTTPGRFVMLAVSDTGCGMDEETRRQIFEPFFTTKQEGEGTGLGLATVYGIVRQHDGDISVYSEEGIGTSFKVYLPRIDEEVAETAADEDVVPSRQGSETILIVEDDENVRKIAQRKLKMEGYQVLVAATPSEAERLFSEHSGAIDLLLTDVVMPEMDGPALHSQLSGSGQSLKVLYMSGYTKAAAAYSKVLDSGAPFLQKPFTLAQLGQKVVEVLNA